MKFFLVKLRNWTENKGVSGQKTRFVVNQSSICQNDYEIGTTPQNQFLSHHIQVRFNFRVLCLKVRRIPSSTTSPSFDRSSISFAALARSNQRHSILHSFSLHISMTYFMTAFCTTQMYSLRSKHLFSSMHHNQLYPFSSVQLSSCYLG